nr:hypothetical protein [Lachnobacterium bovis]
MSFQFGTSIDEKTRGGRRYPHYVYNVRQRQDGSYYNLEYAKPITIEGNCWLASNVVVCGGVTIGEGSEIGAGSVVTRNIPPHSLAAGNPCRVVRTLTAADRMKPKTVN